MSKSIGARDNLGSYFEQSKYVSFSVQVPQTPVDANGHITALFSLESATLTLDIYSIPRSLRRGIRGSVSIISLDSAETLLQLMLYDPTY